MNVVLLRLCALLLLLPAAAFSADWNIDQLMQALSHNKSGRATFTEKKYISYLDAPVESTGELYYAAPDTLEKRTIQPKPENMRVEGDTITLERGRKKHVVQAQQYPELAGFIDGIRGTLTGDRQMLERLFALKLSGPEEGWMLTLTPADAGMKEHLELIRITGSRDNVRSIEILHPGGDRSVMTIQRTSAK